MGNLLGRGSVGWGRTPELSMLRLGQCRDGGLPLKRVSGVEDSQVKLLSLGQWRDGRLPGKRDAGVRR